MTTSQKTSVFLQIKPLLCGILLGMAGALGFYCMSTLLFMSSERHPYFAPFCAICGFMALVACICILWWCFRRFHLVERKTLILCVALALTVIAFCLSFPAWARIMEVLRIALHPYLK